MSTIYNRISDIVLNGGLVSQGGDADFASITLTNASNQIQLGNGANVIVLNGPTPSTNRTITFPNASGTVALVGGGTATPGVQYSNGTGINSIPNGIEGDILTMASGIPQWSSQTPGSIITIPINIYDSFQNSATPTVIATTNLYLHRSGFTINLSIAEFTTSNLLNNSSYLYTDYFIPAGDLPINYTGGIAGFYQFVEYTYPLAQQGTAGKIGFSNPSPPLGGLVPPALQLPNRLNIFGSDASGGFQLAGLPVTVFNCATNWLSTL